MADPLDILTEAEAKRAALGTEAAASGHTDQIARMNTAISRRIDELVGPVVQREVTEYHDGDVEVLLPRQTPVADVTTVTEWDGSTQTALTADTWGTAGASSGYIFEQSTGYGHSARVLRRSSGNPSRFATGSQSVRLVYTAGRYADTASVDARFKEAAAEILRRLWNREAGAWARGADPFQDDLGGGTSRFFRAVDHVVDELLGDEMRPPAIA